MFNWVVIRLHPLIIEERIPYQPKFKGPILLCTELIINSSNNIKYIDPIIIKIAGLNIKYYSTTISR